MPARKLGRRLLPIGPRSPSSRGHPRIELVFQLNRWRVSYELSSSSPSVELPLFFLGHRARGDRESLSVRKLDYDTKQISSRPGLSKNIIDRIFTGRLSAPHPCLTETRLLDFFRLNLVFGYVINTVLWPNKLMDEHSLESTMASRSRQPG